MNAHEHTDPHGDGLTITHDDGKMWITCTTAHAEVTVGPLTPGILTDYDMDGGVAAALIEKEAEQPLTFADRLGAASINAHQAREAEKDAKHWRERCAELEHRLNLAVQAAEYNEGRAEKAEKERDEARRERGEALDRLCEASRSLTPDAITDEMIDRAMNVYIHAEGSPRDAWRAGLTAALTEPPKRPEGAERWEGWLIHNLDHEALTDQQIEDLANRVAQRVTEENTEKETNR